MTTTNPTTRTLRRSRTGRVGAGVAGGLGEYFGLDPVLFRVLFATSAFFGGAGVIAYLLAWAAIPEEGTAHAPIDGWIGGLRRRRVPPWGVAIVAAAIVWILAFSWWSTGPLVPVLVIVVVLVIVYGRRDLQAESDDVDASAVNLTKPAAPQTQPSWMSDARAWFDESRAAARARRRRALPVKIATLAALVVALTVLGIVDAASGVELQLYFWAALGIVTVGLLGGLASRRFPISIATLLIPSALGAIAFAGSHASLHDGVGQREWKPTGTPPAAYKLAFGQGILDLRSLPVQDAARTIRVTMGAGQVEIIAPKSLNLTVAANVHFGDIRVDQNNIDGNSGGVNYNRTIEPPKGATGQPLKVIVHLADGDVAIERR